MKLQFKHQKFQADAANAVCDVFAGQPYYTPTYMIDKGSTDKHEQMTLGGEADYTGFSNHKVIHELSDGKILENLNRIQRSYQIEPSPSLAGHYNLTIEMETGVGKTYTYIKTMLELLTVASHNLYSVSIPDCLS
jgi:type III restriction enzyme